LWDHQLEHDTRNDIDNSVIDDWYRTLIAMFRQVPESDLLIEGAGNFGSPEDPPAYPSYTGCRLTKRGSALADRLFMEYPRYK
jgi:DNA gyrase/topoisomerase IV subunit A